MPAPNEGTQNLPSDAVGRFHEGLWDATAGVFRAKRSDAQGNQRVALYDAGGAALLTSANPGAVDLTDRAARLLGVTTLGAALPAGNNIIGRVRQELDAPTTWVTGFAIAPAAGAVIADTGAIATGGNYRVEIDMSVNAATGRGKEMEAQHRNAANTAHAHWQLLPAPGVVQIIWSNVPLLVNERVRIVNGPVAGDASSNYNASIRLYRLP